MCCLLDSGVAKNTLLKMKLCGHPSQFAASLQVCFAKMDASVGLDRVQSVVTMPKHGNGAQSRNPVNEHLI